MSKTYDDEDQIMVDAYAIWRGACNTTAVADSIAAAVRWYKSNRGGDPGVRNQPALFLMVYQLMHLMGFHDPHSQINGAINAIDLRGLLEKVDEKADEKAEGS